eukprot:jgi/Chlat1/5023/Chrsp32S04992
MPHKRGYTKYRGVYFYGKNRPKAPKPWVSSIHLRDSARRYIGCFATQQEAALAYDKALVERDGPLAATNQSIYCEDFGDGDQAIAAKDNNLNGFVAVDDSDDDVVFVMEIMRTPPSIAQRVTRKRRNPIDNHAVTTKVHPDGEKEAVEGEHVRQGAGKATGVAGTAHDGRYAERSRTWQEQNQTGVTRSGQRAQPKRAKLAPATPEACERKQKPATKQSRRRSSSLLPSQRDDAGSDIGTDSEDLPEPRTSKYDGVFWDPEMAVWFACIRDRKSAEYQILGYHKQEHVAAMAYDVAVIKGLVGPRATKNTNRFPEDFPRLQAFAQPVTSGGARRQSTTSNKKGTSGGNKATA